jgi:8-oxo-dGTP diphosphatase
VGSNPTASAFFIYMSKSSIQNVICEDVKGKTYTVPSSELSFRPAVYAIIIKDSKILLFKCWDGYDFPGGGIDLGEPTEAALIREVKEETGLDVKVGQIVHCNNSFFKLPFKGNFVHSIHMYYQCQIVGGELSTAFFAEQEKKYASKAEWVDLDGFKDLKIYSSIDANQVLNAYLKKLAT